MCLVGGRILPRLFIISNRQYCHGKLNNDINLTLQLTIFLAEIKRCRCLAQGTRGMTFLGFSFPCGKLRLFRLVIYIICDLGRSDTHKELMNPAQLLPPPSFHPHLPPALFTVSRFDCSHVIRCPVNRNNGCSQDPVNKQYKVLGTSSEITHDVRRFSRLCLKGSFSFFRSLPELSISNPQVSVVPYIYHPCCHAI